MKLTIRKKLFWGMSGLIIIFVLLSQFLNSQLLEYYYIWQKKAQLLDVSDHINNNYLKNSTDIDLELEKLERTTGIHIVVLNSNLELVYGFQKIFVKHTLNQPFATQRQLSKTPAAKFPSPNHRGEGNFEKKLIQIYPKELKEGKAVIISSQDPRMQTNFINLIKKLNNGDYLILNTSFASISESVRIANRFSWFTGLVTFIVGSIIIYFFTRKLTLPILKLNELAQRMARLDFSQKYPVESTDEVGQLGESINSLSTQLHNAISELTTVNQKLLEDIERERRIDELRREFISSVSHELKTPISLIQGYAEGLKENVNEDEENKNFYCEVIADEANKMGKLVRDLLDLSQIEAGTFKLDKSIFEISPLAARVMDKYKPILLEKNINCTLEEKPGLMVYADRFRTEQIIVNYLNNAINHVDDQKLITIGIQSNSSKARIAVYNSGQPISPEALDKVWESFYKVDKARTRAYGGTGLGLSIVKAIQEIDNNRCGILNKDGGVEFWFELDLVS